MWVAPSAGRRLRPWAPPHRQGSPVALTVLLLAAAVSTSVEADVGTRGDDVWHALLLEDDECFGEEALAGGDGGEGACGANFLQRQALLRQRLGRQQELSPPDVALAPAPLAAAAHATSAAGETEGGVAAQIRGAESAASASVLASAVAADDAQDPHGSPLSAGLDVGGAGSRAKLRITALSFVQEKMEIIKRATVRVTVALPAEAQKAVGHVRSAFFGDGEATSEGGEATSGRLAAADTFARASVATEAGFEVQKLMQHPGRLQAGSLVFLTFMVMLFRSLMRSRWGEQAKTKSEGRSIVLQLPLAVDAWCTASRTLCGGNRKGDSTGGAGDDRPPTPRPGAPTPGIAAGSPLAATRPPVDPLAAAGVGVPRVAAAHATAGTANERIMQLVA